MTEPRNHRCQYYEACLNGAVFESTSFHCPGCRHEHDKSNPIDQADLPGLFALIVLALGPEGRLALDPKKLIELVKSDLDVFCRILADVDT